MATTLDITVYRSVSDSAVAAADLEAAYAEVVSIDHLMSLYRPDSELSALNAKAGEGSVPVSDATLDVLTAAKHYERLSDAAVDVTIQPLVDLWGFYRVKQAAVPPQDKINAVLQLVGMDRITLNSSDNTVTLDAGTSLDFGSIAKGYAVDRALKVLRARGVPAALVNLGGNIGVMGHPPAKRPWVVGVQHPREGRLIGTIRFWDGAVSTSGDYDRYFEAGGKRYSHLLDPRTGWPVEGVYALTVVAPNATAADALSTAAFVLGPARGMALLNSCADVEGLLIEPQGDRARGNVERDEANPEDLIVTMTTGSAPDPDVFLQADEGVSFIVEGGRGVTLGPVVQTVDHAPLPDCVWSVGGASDRNQDY